MCVCTRLRKAHNAKRQADKRERDKVLKRTQEETGNTSDEEDSEDTCDMMEGYVSIFIGPCSLCCVMYHRNIPIYEDHTACDCVIACMVYPAPTLVC